MTNETQTDRLAERRAINTVLGKLLAPLVPDLIERVRIGNDACTEIMQSLSTDLANAEARLATQTTELRLLGTSFAMSEQRVKELEMAIILARRSLNNFPYRHEGARKLIEYLDGALNPGKESA